MHEVDPAAALRCSGTPPPPLTDALEWSWPPYAPVPTDGEPFDAGSWAPSSVVRHPRLRLGRWTVLYRRRAGAGRAAEETGRARS